MTDYTNMTDVEIIKSILAEHGFDVAGTLPPVSSTAWFDVEAFTSQPRYKAIQTPEGWDVVETTQEEASNGH